MRTHTTIFNKPELKENRQTLRNNSTEAEQALWQELRRRQLDGRKFRRQQSIDNYVVDFYCPSEQLCVELDGADHFTEEGKSYDAKRTAYLESLGLREVRFENKQVFEDM